MNTKSSTRRKLRSAISNIELCEPRLLFSTYVVNTTSDAINPGSGLLTLRQAVTDANNNSGPDTIQFSSTAFAPGSMHTITLAQGPLIFTGSGTTTVTGPGASTLTIDGDGFRALQVNSNASVAISGLTEIDGKVNSSGGVLAAGAGVYNEGALTLTNTTITGNTTTGGSTAYETSGNGGAAEGAGIYSSGTLTLVNSTVSSNTAQAGSSYGGTGGSAGGAGVFATGMLTLTNSMITNNTANGGDVPEQGYATGGTTDGGGVYAGGSLTITGSTLSDNTANGGNAAVSYSEEDSGAPAYGGGIYIAGSVNSISGAIFNGNAVNGGNSAGGAGSAGAASGGAIWSSGPVSLSSSTISDNTVDGGAGPFDDSGPGGNAYGAGISTSASLNISNTSIVGNTATGGSGQSLSYQGKASAFGGGIYATASLSISASTLSGNVAQGDPTFTNDQTYGGFGGYAQGGGLFSSGTATITSSTISGNAARGGMGDSPSYGGPGGAGGAARGGGIFEGNDLTITNSTVANNSATGGAGAKGAYVGGDGGNGGAGYGGGIYVQGGQLMANDSTVSGNTVTGGAGGIPGAEFTSGYTDGNPGVASGGGISLGSSGFTILSNSIVDANTEAGSTEDDIFGSAAGVSNDNLIGAGGGGYISNGTNGNILGVDNPGLLPLGNYGGPTQTMLPLYNSPAVNAGSNSTVPAGVTLDQRGYARIVGGTVDIGAVELQTGSVSGTVFNDLNGDGIQETGEPGLPGVTVYADLSNAGVFKAGDPTTTTDSNGNYTLAGVPEGTVVVRQNLPAGYRQSYPVQGVGEHVNLTPAGVTGALFADSTRLYVSGTVTYNGVGQSGVLVYADLNNDGQFESNENNKTTAGDGSFAFVSLTAGTYTFRIVTPAGEMISGNAAITVTLGSGGVDQNVNFTLMGQPRPLTGTVIGTSGSYNNQGNTAAKAFDGNLSTFFDAPTASGSWAGLDLGTPTVITQISYAPRSGWAGRMVGGTFQASNSTTFASGVVNLYVVTATPATGMLTTVPISNTTAYRYVRYIGPANSYCDIAEAQFFGTPPASGGATLQPDGTLLVNGTSGNDTISVIVQDDPNAPSQNLMLEITVDINGTSQTFDEPSYKAVVISTSSGNDAVTVNTEQAEDEIGFPISITSGDGNDAFNMEVAVDTHLFANEQVSINAGNGNDSFQLGGGNVSYTVVAGNGSDAFSTTIDQLGGMTANLTAGNGNDSFSAGSTGASGTDDVTITAGNGIDTVSNGDTDDDITGTINGQPLSLNNTEIELAGTVYADLNGDGVYETGEPTVAGAPVTFTYNGTAYSTTSAANGTYLLTIPNGNVQGIIAVSGYGRSIPVYGYIGELLDNINIALPPPLGGTVIGTSGSYQNDGNTNAKAFDGNVNTYFDAPTANGNWAGRDLGTAQVVTAIAYAPRAGFASRMVGGIFQGSNSASFANAVNLYTVTTAPTAGMLTYVAISNTSAFRYVRYLSPNGSYGNVAEVQFFEAAATSLTGTIIGTAGSYNNQGNTIANVFDVNLSTFFDGPDATGDWVGLDLGTAQVVTQVEYAPRAGWTNRMVGGEIQASNTADFSSGVVTLYTIASAPTAGVLTTASFTNTTAYRYYRYIGPTDGYCNIAELILDA